MGNMCQSGTYCVAGSASESSCPAGKYNPGAGLGAEA